MFVVCIVLWVNGEVWVMDVMLDCEVGGEGARTAAASGTDGDA